jgi:hypothetical protein
MTPIARAFPEHADLDEVEHAAAINYAQFLLVEALRCETAGLTDERDSYKSQILIIAGLVGPAFEGQLIYATAAWLGAQHGLPGEHFASDVCRDMSGIFADGELDLAMAKTGGQA